MYNDLSWQAGQLGSNITVYTTGQSGFLRDYATGAATAVRLAISGGTVSDATRAQGSNASSGTDGYNVFNGIVDSVGLISYSAANLSFSFTGLDPNLRYEFVLFGNRNVAAYTDRLTRVAISDVVEFTNSSTAGAAFSGPADPAATMVNGYNTANGYVARFTDVNPGTDGDMLITVSSGDGHFYANALMLRAVEPFANQPPTAVNDSAATDANRAVVIDVVANDTDPDGAIDPATVVVTVPPGHGTALANANGTVTYTPAAGYSGTDSFWYTVEDNDGDSSNQALVTVTVVSSGASDFSDDFSTNSTGQYTVVSTWTQGGVGAFSYDSTGKRARVRTGDNVGLQVSRLLSCSDTGSFSIDFLPTKKYPSGGWLYLRLIQDASNYYEIQNTDGYGAKGITKVVNGQVVDSANFKNGYVQNTNYAIDVDFSPGQTVVKAFGNALAMGTNTSGISVCGFEVELSQQDAYIDNISYVGD